MSTSGLKPRVYNLISDLYTLKINNKSNTALDQKWDKRQIMLWLNMLWVYKLSTDGVIIQTTLWFFSQHA